MTDITLLDGGMGQELVRRSGDTPTALWSTRVMRDHPGLVKAVHADYFAAGATIATANTYAIHRDRLAHVGAEDQFEALHATALAEAHAAQSAHGAGRVAGAIGPLAASYRPDIHPALEEATPLYAEIIALMVPNVDLIIAETVSSVLQARALIKAAEKLDIPFWLAVSVDDEDGSTFRSGEPVADIIPILNGRVAAVLANCSSPEAMPKAMDALATTDLPFGAYANAFTQITKDFLKHAPTVDALTARRDMGPEPYADHAMAWVRQGATIIGGCCETGPDHIAEIARRLIQAGHNIT